MEIRDYLAASKRADLKPYEAFDVDLKDPEHVELMQKNRVQIWREGQSQQELGMDDRQIRELGQAYMEQPGFRAVSVMRAKDGAQVAYCLSYICDLAKDNLNLAGEVVVSPEAQEDLKEEIHKHMGGFYNDISQKPRDLHWDRQMKPGKWKVFVMNGMGVIKEERNNFVVAAMLVRKMFDTLQIQCLEEGINSPWGLFYTWRQEEKPSFYSQMGFKRLDFEDPADRCKKAEIQTSYWLADWGNRFKSLFEIF